MDRFLTVNFAAPLRRLFNGHDSGLCIPILMYHAITDDPEPGVRGYYRLNTPPSLFREHLQILKNEGFTVMDLPTAVQHLSNAARFPSPSSSSANPFQLSTFSMPQLKGRPSPSSSSSSSSSSSLSPTAREPNGKGGSSSSANPSQLSAFSIPLSKSPPSSAVGRPSSVLRPRTPRYAVITFDDGFRDFATHAVPALAEHGFPATNFIITGSAGGRFKDRECLSWAELRDLQTAGISFGSHTVTHPRLWELDDSNLHGELIASKRTIEDQLGSPVETFAHPYAFPRANAHYVDRYSAAVRSSGYRVGVTTSLGCAGPGDDVWTLKRLPANGADDAALFHAKLIGAYDWLAVPQAAFKRLKGNRQNPSHK